MLFAFSSPPFYTEYVRLPSEDDPIPPEIINNPKCYPFFQHALGALDGSHFHAFTTAEGRHAAWNRKGEITQNCLMACSFDLRFMYVCSGWEGSAADAHIYNDARLTDFHIPCGKYYLADAGFASCDELLVPYRGTRYHLAEWGRADVRPKDKEELFNLRHSSARNVIECIFGVLKCRFKILCMAPEYDMDIQARIPPALCTIHNFIRIHDPEELENTEEDVSYDDNVSGHTGELAPGPPDRAARVRANERWDEIAQAMWVSYLEYLHGGGPEIETI